MSAAKDITARADAPVMADNGPDMSALMRVAVEQGEAGVAALERLVALKERDEDRYAARQYAEAIARFQENCPIVGKNAAGAHGARYATLDQVMATIRPALADAGLSVTFDSEDCEDGKLKIWAVIHHKGAHSERASFTVSREAKSNRMNDTQRDGSALAYGRRYALCMALGISTGDADDDGAGADRDAKPINDEQAATVQALIDEVKADRAAFLKYFKAESVGTLPASRYREAVAMLERKR